MSKLVDKERLAQLAKALDQRAKAAVAAEKKERVAAESRIEGKADQNAAAITAINNEENGLLAQAQLKVNALKDELDPKITAKVEESVYSAKVTELESKDSEMAKDILGLDTAIKGINERLGDTNLNLPAIDEAIKEFQEAQQGIDAKQNQDIVKAQEAADKAQEEVDALEGVVDGIDERVVEAENFIKGHSHAEIEADIQTLEGKVEDLEGFVEEHDHQPIVNRIVALEEMHSEGGDVDQKIAAVQGDVDALEQAYTKFIGEQAAKDQGQDQLIAAKADKATYEAKVEELEGKDAELDKAIKDEAARAAGVEQGLQQAIDAINDAEDGILAQAKSHAQGLVDTEKGAREDADTALDNRLKVVEASVGDGGALATKVAANEAKLAGLEKDTVKAEIEQAEADAKAYADEKITALVDSAPDAMNTLNELAEAIKGNKGIYDAYIAEHATAMAKQKEDLQKEIDDDIADAKALISAEIDADVKAEADRAKAEEADIRADFAAADAALHTTISAEIDADVKVEKDRAEAAEKAITDRLDVLEGEGEGSVAKAIEDAVKVEKNRALAQEAAIRSEFAAADLGLSGRIADLEEMMGVGGEEAGKSALEEIREDITALKQKDADLVKEDARLAGEIAKKVDQGAYDTKVQALEAEDERIAGLVQQAQDEVDAVEIRMGTAEGKITTLEGFINAHSHEAMEDQIALNKQGVADNKAAIEKEVEDRDAAIEEALKVYSTTEEMKSILGNVVNSLALTMENNQVVLKLGGTEGIALTSVALDMVTDGDIDEIMAGLDSAE